MLVVTLMAAAAWSVDYLGEVVGVRRAGASRQAGAGAEALLSIIRELIGLLLVQIVGAMTD